MELILERTELGDALAAELQEKHRDKEPYEIYDEYEQQIQAARYYVHKLITHKYGVLVQGGVISFEQGQEAYTEAMRNYDGVISDAVSGNGHLVGVGHTSPLRVYRVVFAGCQAKRKK